jgi:hypothetical protein
MLNPLGGDLPDQALADGAAYLTVTFLIWSLPFVGLSLRARGTESSRELGIYRVISVAAFLVTAMGFVLLFLVFPLASAAIAPFLVGPALLWWSSKGRLQRLRERLLRL